LRDRELNKIRFANQYKRFGGYDKVEPRLDFFFETGGKEHHKNDLFLSYAWVNSSRSDYAPYENPMSIAKIGYESVHSNALLTEEFKLGLRYVYMKNDMNLSPDNINFIRLEGSYYRSQRLGKRSHFIARGYLGFSTDIDRGYVIPMFSNSSPDYAKDYYMIDRARNGQAGWLGRNQSLFDQEQFVSLNVSDQVLLSTHFAYKYRIFQPYVSALYAGDFYYESELGLALGAQNIYFPITSNGFANQLPENGKQWSESIHFSLNMQLSRLWNVLDMSPKF